MTAWRAFAARVLLAGGAASFAAARVLERVLLAGADAGTGVAAFLGGCRLRRLGDLQRGGSVVSTLGNNCSSLSTLGYSCSSLMELSVIDRVIMRVGVGSGVLATLGIG